MPQPVESVEEIFSQLTKEDELVLISLPYRVGLYVSFADTTGGWDAQEAEMQSLSNILREFAEDFCKSEFSQKVLMESLRARDLWPSWSQDVESVPDEAGRVMRMLESFFEERALRAFKEVLVEIAMAVAMAFRESAPDATVKQARFSTVGNILIKLMGKKEPFDPLGHINVSKNERAALNRLCTALNYDMNQR